MSDLDETNFREFAQKCIKKYADKGNIVDTLVWGRIVALYEARLVNAEAALCDIARMSPSEAEEEAPAKAREAMRKVHDAETSEVLYRDTDSVITRSRS